MGRESEIGGNASLALGDGRLCIRSQDVRVYTGSRQTHAYSYRQRDAQ